MDTCQNCGAVVSAKYCPDCGQEKITKRYEVKTILHDITHGIFHWENSILRTFKSLITRPGHFIKEFIHGKRKSFVKPFSYFLFIQTVYVVIFHWLSGNFFAYLNFTFTGDSPIEKVTELQAIINKNVNYLNFLLPLVFAFVFKIFLKKKTGVNYAESLVFAFYTFATILLFGMLFMLLSIIDMSLWNLRFVFNFVFLTIAIMQFAGYRKIKGIINSFLIIALSYSLFVIIIAALTIIYIRYFM
jgi:hypothetical protein